MCGSYGTLDESTQEKLDTIELKEFKKYSGVLDKIICVGSPLKNSVKDLIGMDGVVVPNIVNELFKPSKVTHNGFRFVAVGRLVKIKQFDKIIEAFCDCFLGQKDISLTIIGGGEEKDNLEEIISERKAGDQIKLVGSQTREKTAEMISNCDNLICYSRFETFGVPIIERGLVALLLLLLLLRRRSLTILMRGWELRFLSMIMKT